MRLVIMRWEIQIEGHITSANFWVCSMQESSRSRLILSILCNVLSWMIDVVNWLLYVSFKSRLSLFILYDVLSWIIDVVNWLLCVK